jgi:hypothetical protein
MLSKKDEIIKSTKETLESSSIHAIPNIVRNEHYLIKMVWLIFFLVSSSFCAYFIQESIADYLNYDVITKIDIKYETKLKFPIISICNINPFNSEYFKETYPQFSELGMEHSYLSKAIAYDHENRTLLGKKFNEFVINCAIKINKSCKNESLFEHYYDVNHGNCLRYNSGRNTDGNKLEIEYIFQNGIQSAFELEILIGKTSMNKNMFSIENGFIIFISDEPVDSTTHQGIKISPGFSYNIQIDKYKIMNLPDPYSKCIGDLKSIDSYTSECFRKTILLKLNQTYHYSDCLKVCLQRSLARECGCQTRYYNLVYDKSLRRCENIDRPYNNQSLNDLNCTSNSFLGFWYDSNKINNCDCPLECESTGYIYSVSFAEFPTYKYYTYLYENGMISKFIDQLKQENDADNDEFLFEEVKKSVARVAIFYDELKKTELKQIIKTKQADLVSTIGGTLGLYTGLSFLSLVEIFEIILQISIIYFRNKKIHFQT